MGKKISQFYAQNMCLSKHMNMPTIFSLNGEYLQLCLYLHEVSPCFFLQLESVGQLFNRKFVLEQKIRKIKLPACSNKFCVFEFNS